MSTTHQSEYLKIKSLFLKSAKSAFVSDEVLEAQWQSLNYSEKPSFHGSLQEFKELENYLKKESITVSYFPFDHKTGIDSIYCRDASIATDYGMIICNMGKTGRIGEPAEQKKIFKANGINILGEITAPGTLEGGDVAWLDEKTLLVGHSYRTNLEGIKQLKFLLSPFQVEVIVVDLPHYKGPSDVFHLMSILSPVDKDLAVIYSPLMPIACRNEIIDRGFKFIEVSDGEFETMGCNVLAIAPRKCIMVKGNPKTEAALLQAGCEVYAYRGAEISIKGGGGPTCLTRPLTRYL